MERREPTHSEPKNDLKQLIQISIMHEFIQFKRAQSISLTSSRRGSRTSVSGAEPQQNSIRIFPPMGSFLGARTWSYRRAATTPALIGPAQYNWTWTGHTHCYDSSFAKKQLKKIIKCTSTYPVILERLLNKCRPKGSSWVDSTSCVANLWVRIGLIYRNHLLYRFMAAKMTACYYDYAHQRGAPVLQTAQ